MIFIVITLLVLALIAILGTLISHVQSEKITVTKAIISGILILLGVVLIISDLASRLE